MPFRSLANEIYDGFHDLLGSTNFRFPISTGDYREPIRPEESDLIVATYESFAALVRRTGTFSGNRHCRRDPPGGGRPSRAGGRGTPLSSSRIGPHREAIRDSLAALLGIPPERVGIKAKTNEGLDAIGNRAGIACLAVVLLERMEEDDAWV